MNFPILVVDDESGIRQSLCALLRDEGYSAEAVSSGEECLQATQKKLYSLISSMSGSRELMGGSVAPVATARCAAHGHHDLRPCQHRNGGPGHQTRCVQFHRKPLSLEKVVLAVRNAVDFSRLAQENRHLRGELEQRFQLLGDSVPMKALRQQIALTAPTNGRVLIYGEAVPARN